MTQNESTFLYSGIIASSIRIDFLAIFLFISILPIFNTAIILHLINICVWLPLPDGRTDIARPTQNTSKKQKIFLQKNKIIS